MKILIIVEDRALRNILRDKLQGCGFETLVARSGIEGWEMAKNEKPDVALVDLHVAKRNNFYVLTMLRQHPQLKDIPIFILSDMGDDEDMNKISHIGIEDFFIKQQCPIDDVVKKIKKKIAP